MIKHLEFGAQGNNPRFIVTNLTLPASELYDDLYCQRGEAENRIKEAQLDLFGTRTSCHRFLANWLRTLFSALAYTLMQALKRLALKGTELAKATSATTRTRLLKIGAMQQRFDKSLIHNWINRLDLNTLDFMNGYHARFRNKDFVLVLVVEPL